MIVTSKKISKGTSAYPFTGCTTIEYKEIYKYLVNFYAEDILRCDIWKEAEAMKKLNFTTSKLLFYLDGHYKKMTKHTGFRLLELFVSLVGVMEGSILFKKLPKK